MLSASVMLSACGGAGSSDEGSQANPAQTTNLQTGISLEGRAVKGVISNGLVYAYNIVESNGRLVKASQSIAGPVRTDNSGNYSLSVPTSYAGQQLIVEVGADSETRMKCEATSGCSEGGIFGFGEVFAPGTELLLSNVSAPLVGGRSNQAHVTPFTHMARVKAEVSGAGFTDANVAQAFDDVESMFGMDDGVLMLPPIDVTNASERSQASVEVYELALISAALHELANTQEYNGVVEVIESISERLTVNDSLAYTDLGSSETVAIDDLLYSAQEVLSDIEAVYQDEARDDLSNLAADMSEKQLQAQELGSQVIPVQIVTQPVDIVISEGERGFLTASVIAGGPIGFQWFKNGVAIEGSGSAALTIDNAALDDAGTYALKVSNSVGSVVSRQVVVTVHASSINEPVDQGGADQGGTDQGGTDQGDTDQGDTDQGGTDQGDTDQGGTDQGGTDPQNDIALTWDIPLEREDGSQLELYEINGYTIKYGTDSSSMDILVDVLGASNTSYTLVDMSAGTYYFAISTVDSDGVQGQYSATIQVTVN